MKNSFFKEGTFWAMILIIAITSLVYANSLRNSFAGDDFSIIANNDFVKFWRNLPAIFSSGYLDTASEREYLAESGLHSGEKTYRPLVTISYFVDYSLWKLNPFGYHLTNLLLHIINLLLLYLLIGLIARDKKIALLTALLFGLHPVNSEAVNAIAFREDLLAFLFLVSSLILFIKSDSYPPKRRFFAYCASVSLYLLALFSKEMAITLPVLLILYDYYFLFQEKPKGILSNLKSRYLGYILASLLYLGVRFLLIRNIDESLIGYPGDSFYVNILTMPKVFVAYLIWLLLPIDIHVTLSDPSLFSYFLFKPEVLFAMLTMVSCLVLAILLCKSQKLISFAMLYFFITLLPVFNIIPIANIMASRYLYIPAVGFCLVTAGLLSRLPKTRVFSVPPHILKRLAKYTVVVLVVFYSTFTIIRGFTWRNNITLWLEAVEYYPDNDYAHRGLGDCFRKCGLLDKAIGEYKRAIELNPYHIKTYNILGVCCGEKKLYQEALDYLKQAIEINPRYVEAYNNLGITFAKMENWAEAEKAWKKVLEIDPEYKDAQANLEKLKRV